MNRTLNGLVAVSAILAVLTAVCTAGASTKNDASKGAREILTIGKPGAESIDLKIRTDYPKDQVLKAGDSVVLHVKASKKAYLTAIYVSSKGDAVVLFPNAKTLDNTILPDKEYTFFGEESGIKLKVSDKMKEGQIVFFASSEPISLDPLRPSAGQVCIKIQGSAEKEINELKQKIHAMAKDKGFNRLVLALKAGGTQGVSLNLMGLPTSVKTDKPEGITGVQGVKQKEIKEGESGPEKE